MLNSEETCKRGQGIIRHYLAQTKKKYIKRNLPALSKSNDVTFGHDESGRHVSGQVAVTLLETVVFGNVVKVITTNDNSPLHLGGDNHTTNDTSTDGHVSSEGALLVYVVSIHGLARSLEAETDILPVTGAAATLSLGDTSLTLSDEDSRLLLESRFSLKV